MRLNRVRSFIFPALLLVVAAGGLHGQTFVTLGASQGCTNLLPTASPGTCALTARVSGLADQTLTWSVTPTGFGFLTNSTTTCPGASCSNGTQTNILTAAPGLTSKQTVVVTVKAADNSTTASAQVTVTPGVATVQVTPSVSQSLSAGGSTQFTATVLGVSNTAVTWTMSAQVGSLTPNGNTATYTAPNPITANQTVTIRATSVFDPSVSATGTVQLTAPAVVSVSVTPSTASLTPSQAQQFTAAVSNAASNSVAWSISPQVGTIDQNGLYTAPGILTVTTKVTVTATSVSDPTKAGTATVTVTPLVAVGDGAPTETMQFVFQAAFRRNGFGNVVVMPPAGMVRPFGSVGYVQEFTDAAVSTAKDALVTGASSVGGVNVAFQILAPLYAYYSSVSANTAGYPLADSQSCAAQGVACQWDTFDKGYALFSYASALPNGFGPNLAVNGAFYTEWIAGGGGIGGLGPAVSTTSSITAAAVAPATVGTTATAQLFANGAMYSITAGGNRGKVFSVLQPLYDLYSSQSGPSGSLGLPASEVYQVSATVYKQNFEGGVLQYTPGSGTGVLLPVASVRIDGAQSATVKLAVGQSVTLTATPVLTTGVNATDRPVSWTTTNGKALSIQASGGTAVVTAVGAGAASVQAASQGVTSARVNFIVTSPCCAIGDGAPAGVQQAFRDALTRNRLSVDLPLPSPAARVAGGYVQMAPAAGSNAVYLLAQSDRLGTAYVVAGAVLARYQALGGAAGQLGYPASDATPGGTQVFAGGALGGNPVRLVTGPVLAKWALLGYDAGAAGLPAGDAIEFATLGANAGQQQAFSNGSIVGAVTGPRAGQAYFVSGAILARYTALGGPSGDFGMPTTDEFASGGVRQQNFEGGTITYASGGASAQEHPAARVPSVLAFPPAVTAGARARLAVTGFPNNSTLRVSITGSPDFVVAAPYGAFSWEMPIALSARSGALAIHAADGNGSSADGTLTIRGFADNRVQMAIAQGNNQVGLPGSLLPLPLRIVLADASNTPVAGAAVTFTASTGAQLSAATALTDALGQAEVSVRLPAANGVVGVTATSLVAAAPVTFYVRAAGNTLTNVPPITMAGGALLGKGPATVAQKGALLTAVATILRYHQNRGELPAPNGSADPASLNDFLTQYCTVDLNGAQVCDGYVSAGAAAEQVVNLWRAAEFTGGVDVTVRNPAAADVADVLAQGSPALLSLALSRNGVPAGGHFVVATGIAADGSIVIADPSSYFARASLADYLGGFNSGGAAWSGELRGVVQFTLRSAPATRFLIGAPSQPAALMATLAIDVRSPEGVCGTPLDLLDAVDGGGNPSGGLVSRFVACDGGASMYQIGLGAAQPYRAFVTDLATAGSSTDLSGSAAATYQATRVRLNLTLAPQAASFTAEAVVNAATFAPGIAPGGIVSVFGSGLAGAGTATTLEFDGEASAILLESPFQVNAVVPADVGPGAHLLRLRSAFGTVERTVVVSAVAPGIFIVGAAEAGAVLNPDYSLNTPSSPVTRGQYLSIYSTGLGATTGQGSQSAVTTPVTVVVGGQELSPIFAGLAPGFPGLYQVNVVIPAVTAPGLGIPLALKQGGQTSNSVVVHVR